MDERSRTLNMNWCFSMYKKKRFQRNATKFLRFIEALSAGNIFTPLRQSLYSSRGGGVVNAPASRSNKRGLSQKAS